MELLLALQAVPVGRRCNMCDGGGCVGGGIIAIREYDMVAKHGSEHLEHAFAEHSESTKIEQETTSKEQDSRARHHKEREQVSYYAF